MASAHEWVDMHGGDAAFHRPLSIGNLPPHQPFAISHQRLHTSTTDCRALTTCHINLTTCHRGIATSHLQPKTYHLSPGLNTLHHLPKLIILSPCIPSPASDTSSSWVVGPFVMCILFHMLIPNSTEDFNRYRFLFGPC